MATCKKCGIELKAFRSYDKMCNQCALTEMVEQRQNLVNKVSNSSSHCQATFTDVVVDRRNVSSQIGDLFLTTDDLVYISYAIFPIIPKWAEGAGYMADGVVGGVGMALIRMKEVQNARNSASTLREMDTGMAIEERIRKRGGFVLSKKEIHAVESDPRSQMIRITLNEEVLIMGVTHSDSMKNTISQWLAGTLQDEEDVLLVNAHLPEVGDLVKKLLTSSKVDAVDLTIFEKAVRCKPYFEAFFKLLYPLKKQEKERALINISSVPRVFVDTLLTRLNDATKAERKNMRDALVCAIILASLGLVFGLYEIINNKEPTFITFFGFMCGLGFLIALLVALIYRSDSQVYLRMLNILKVNLPPGLEEV